MMWLIPKLSPVRATIGTLVVVGAALAPLAHALPAGMRPLSEGQAQDQERAREDVAALIEAAGGEAVQLGTCRDDRASITAGFLITSYSIHYTKLYEPAGRAPP